VALSWWEFVEAKRGLAKRGLELDRKVPAAPAEVWGKGEQGYLDDGV